MNNKYVVKLLEARIDELKSPYIAIDCIKERIVELQKQQKEKEWKHIENMRSKWNGLKKHYGYSI